MHERPPRLLYKVVLPVGVAVVVFPIVMVVVPPQLSPEYPSLQMQSPVAQSQVPWYSEVQLSGHTISVGR